MDNPFQKSKINIYFCILISLVIMFCFTLWYLRVEYHFQSDENMTIHSQTGIWDLTEYDFSKGFVIASGSEEYIEGKLVAPDAFDMEAIKVGSTSLPVNTSRITFYMPTDNAYTIMGNSFDFAERIYINGEFVKEIGSVGLTADTSSPDHAYLNITVSPKDGVIEIVRQSNNFVHRDNGVASHIFIGTPETMSRLHAALYSITGIMIGLFITIAISHIFLFVLFQKYKAHLYFAILALTWGLRLGVTDIKVFSEWFAFLPWEIMFRFEYMTVPLACAMFLLVANEIFPQAIPKWFVCSVSGLFLFYTALCPFVPTIPLSYSMIGVIIFYTIALLAIAILLFANTIKMHQSNKLKLEHILFMISVTFLIIAAVHDGLYYNRILLFGMRILLMDLAFSIILFTQTVVIYHDTAQKMKATYRAEQESRIEASSLRKAKKMHEDFLRALSHEMQIPLTTISGYAQLTSQILIEDEMIDKIAMLDKMRVIDDEARKLSRQVAQLLDASAMENGTFKLHLQKVDLNDLLAKIATQHFPTMNDGSIKLIISCPPNLPMAYADNDRLRGCILNLVSNAIKHTEAGSISIETKAEKSFIEIAVTDTGEGIPPKLLSDLFHSYPKYRSSKGNGLGLYIVAQTIESHGGKILAQSTINEGTTITFTIPIWEESHE